MTKLTFFQIGEDQLLWKNHIIQKEIEKEKLEAMKSNEMFSCSECANDRANQYCCDCKWKLCNECSSYHKKCVRYNGHQVKSMNEIPVEDLVEVEVIICHKHKQMLKYYCDTCQASICNDCTFSKVHQNHSFKLMAEIIEAEIQLLKQLIPNARSKGKECEAYLKRVEEFMNGARETKENSIKVVDDTFDALIEILVTEKHNLKQWINEAYNSSKDSLKRASDELKILAPATEYLEKILEYPREEVIDVVLEGRKQLAETIRNIEDVTKQKENTLNSISELDVSDDEDYPFEVRFCDELELPSTLQTSTPTSTSDPQNVFNVTALSRGIVNGPYVEMIKTAIKQISFLQQQTLPIPLAQNMNYNQQNVYREDRRRPKPMPVIQGNGCTHLPDNKHYLPQGIYLPHAFTSSGERFQK